LIKVSCKSNEIIIFAFFTGFTWSNAYLN
jgi:hypothetical protein